MKAETGLGLADAVGRQERVEFGPLDQRGIEGIVAMPRGIDPDRQGAADEFIHPQEPPARLIVRGGQLADVHAAGVGPHLHLQVGIPSTDARPD